MRILHKKQKLIQNKKQFHLRKDIINKIQLLIQRVGDRKCLTQSSKCLLQKSIIFTTIILTSIDIYSYKISVKIDFNRLLIVYRSILLKNNRILIIDSQQLRMNFIHKIFKKSLEYSSQLFFNINQQNGSIEILNKINYSKIIFSSISQLLKEIQNKIRSLIQYSRKYLCFILNEINEKVMKIQQMRSYKYQNLQKIKRHIYFSSFDLGLSQKASQYKYPSQQILKKRQIVIKNLLKRDTNKQKVLCQGILYGLIGSRVNESKQWRKQFETTHYFEKLLQIPIARANIANQNIHIYNEIEIDKPQKVMVQNFINPYNKTLKIGVYTIRYLINNKKDIVRDQRQNLVKCLLIKNAKDESVRQRNKIILQKNIVKLFNSGSSSYLLKYYNCQQNNFIYKNSLLMDYNNMNITLSDYLLINKNILSIQSKLNILSHISNALRFLNYYKIVHMDLKLNNILIYDGYLPKIIDFGQAYNRQVIDRTIKTQYRPGNTLPYCPPQVFTQNQFTISQDIFSFGMIIFRVLFNSFPFFDSDELRSFYKNKTYHQRFYFCPQKLSMICQQKVCFLLIQMINFCLKTEKQRRPLPIWSTIIIKQILAYFYL